MGNRILEKMIFVPCMVIKALFLFSFWPFPFLSSLFHKRSSIPFFRSSFPFFFPLHGKATISTTKELTCRHDLFSWHSSTLWYTAIMSFITYYIIQHHIIIFFPITTQFEWSHNRIWIMFSIWQVKDGGSQVWIQQLLEATSMLNVVIHLQEFMSTQRSSQKGRISFHERRCWINAATHS